MFDELLDREVKRAVDLLPVYDMIDVLIDIVALRTIENPVTFTKAYMYVFECQVSGLPPELQSYVQLH